jgi:hypothetical protein
MLGRFPVYLYHRLSRQISTSKFELVFSFPVTHSLGVFLSTCGPSRCHIATIEIQHCSVAPSSTWKKPPTFQGYNCTTLRKESLIKIIITITMPHRTRDEGQDRQNSARSGPYSNTTSTTCSREVHPIESSDRDTIVESKWPKTWRAYVCWLACFFLMFNSWGLVNAYGTFSSYYLGHSLKSVDQLGLNIIGSTESFLVLLFSAPIGRLLDAGHYRFIIGTGTFLVPFGLFMLGVAHPTAEGASADFGSIWATQGLVVGLGMSCFFVSSSQSK